ncbi:Oxidoreductase, short chain dehydrogenase/reductase family protein [Sulfitobacter noctilucicola]|uniref:NAD(P)-dependent dehydrogenase (Short-subunit alcohol dehydrogenase family) n=1 Tax=Sulfitobacter noctilucicola TaxID=1342301 RepID=A0A7W6Q564_9RHOB|nr:SDR family NAD(P)-dependent oxidoreductase [Sulfitobacter noctilucicola]KIN63566.1 Oxidoreductase, short chain dehydrogenase/reductase family protein [Sulfitobacter noctilucicola]MBB4174924.1 NAD(P)-dependent dehydrogenase (short-subunit alcohol dehydrogenase family) [Sulfitobacter noctilucicola]
MKTAVISGGNGGLGRAMADQLEAQGWHCVLLDVNIAGLAKSASRTPIAVDLTDQTALKRAASEVITARPSIDMVIYNAGVTQVAPFDETDADSHRRLFGINYFAAVEMARIFLHPLRESRGTHLAVSSVAGFSPLYGRTAYAASKHAMQGFFSTLRSEEMPFGVRCMIAAPSFVATNTGNAERGDDAIMRPGAAADGIDHMTPEMAAKAILKGVQKGQEFIPVGRVARLATLLVRLSPALYQWAMRRNMRADIPKN